MENLWNNQEADRCISDLELRVYSSNLLGKNKELVLHGGGNTSVKSIIDGEGILYVKGSGWDLESIKPEGFSPVKLSKLLEMVEHDKLSDTDMVNGQKSAMIDATAPNPSVEAILHAIIPFKFVDHTHADAIVTISNSQNGDRYIEELYPNFLIVPYVMPGFFLAKKVNDIIENTDWDSCEGIILHNHGIFTFDNDAKKSYDKMIDAVTKAEKFLDKKAPLNISYIEPTISCNLDRLKQLISNAKGQHIKLKINQTQLALTYASKENIEEFATRGVLTPEHVIRTKHQPLIINNNNIEYAIEEYMEEYEEYFYHFATDETMLNSSPNYAVIKDFGVVVFGKTDREVNIINDIVEHTMRAVLRADMLGGYDPIDLEDSFRIEYWELEQAKLR